MPISIPMKKTNAFVLILILTTTLFIWTPIAATISDPEQNSDAILTAYGKVLSSKGIDPAQANFPLEAKRQILKTMEKDNLAVIAGFYYRDLDNNGQYDAGEELSATLLGGPEIDAKGISQNSYFNCYWLIL